MVNKKKISIKDIAKMAGISVSSVSRILNQTGRYSKETEKKVLKIVEEYGYTANMAAKSLRCTSTKTIGLMVPDITNEFFSKIAYFCETYLHEKGYTLFICNTNNSELKEIEYFTDFASKSVDGIIAMSYLNSLPKSLENSEIPIVVLDRVPRNKKVPYIINDEQKGSYDATEHLIEQGCKNIISIVPAGNILHDNEIAYRSNGYKAAMDYYQLPYDKNNPSYYLDSSQSSNIAAEELMFHLLKNGKKIDGVFCGSDRIALGVTYAIHRFGLHIPKDIKVIGFDNSMYSQLAIPSISTVARNSKQLSIKACDTLLEMIKQQTLIADSFVIPTRLIKRDSTKDS